MLSVFRIVNQPVTSNCFVLFDNAVGNDCVLIDPGSKDESELLAFLEKEKLKPQYIILTHEHFDHCWGVNQLVELYHIPVVCSALCADCIKYEKRNCSIFYDVNERFEINSETINVESLNNEMLFAGSVLRFYMTYGHTNSSMSFTIDNYLFTGDTLIKDLRTVTKLPTGSVTKLQESIELFRSMQGKKYMVYPGHGDLFELDGYDLELMVNGDVPK